jgi:hypothetical protein
MDEPLPPSLKYQVEGGPTSEASVVITRFPVAHTERQGGHRDAQ